MMNRLIHELKPCDFNKTELNKLYIIQTLLKTQSMFKYDNLPDSIPSEILELYLQTNGNVLIAEHNNKLYAFTGGLGGVLDEYYRPTKYTVANPYLNLSKTYSINENSVLIKSDSLYQGLIPLISKYAYQLSENDITMNIADINTRITSLISATDENSYQSALKYLSDILDGKLGIVQTNAFLDGIKTVPYANTANNQLTNLIEYHQYLKASLMNDLGLNSNYNMKRESINSGESQLNNDVLFPLVDNMLFCRQQGIDLVNKMFGTDIKVSLNSSWEDNKIELEKEQDNMGGDNNGIHDTESTIDRSRQDSTE